MWTREDGIRHLKPLKGRSPQHVDSEAYGINEARQVVGVSCDADFVDCRAVVWNHGNNPQTSMISKAAFLLISKAPKTSIILDKLRVELSIQRLA